MARTTKLKYVKLSDIKVGVRFREDLGNIEELIQSIREKGILQPITLDSDYNLQAGGRRVHAATCLQLKEVPALIRESSGLLDLREVELIENAHRKDFTWQEKAKLIFEVDQLYREKDPDWSIRKASCLLEESIATMSRYIQLAKALKVIPDIRDCDSMQDAMRMLKRYEENKITSALRKHQDVRIESSREASASGLANALSMANNHYIIADAFTELSKLRTGGKIHFVECDPPYGIDLANTKKGQNDDSGSLVSSYAEIKSTDYKEFLQKLTAELFRVTYKDAWMVFWYGQTWYTEVKQSLEDAGWQVDDIPAVWIKSQGQSMHPNSALAKGYETFLVCRKGAAMLNKPGALNVLTGPHLPPADKYHPTQRPKWLIDRILSIFLFGNETILVPFLGSGMTLRSAFSLGFHAFGFDINGEYKDRFLLEVEKDFKEVIAQSTNSEA